MGNQVETSRLKEGTWLELPEETCLSLEAAHQVMLRKGVALPCSQGKATVEAAV